MMSLAKALKTKKNKFNADACGYLLKPFVFREFGARVSAQLPGRPGPDFPAACS